MTNSFQFNQKKTTLLFIILFLLILVFFIYLYYQSKRDPLQETIDLSKNQVIQKLNDNPEFLQTLSPETLPEYFRQRLIFFTNTTDDPYTALAQEISQKFPGEQGRVIIEILSSWRYYTRGKKILREQNKFDYDYLQRTINLQQKIFGESLAYRMFPKTNTSKIRLFYAWADKFLIQSPDLSTNAKKIEIEKKRVEMYGDQFDTLISMQPYEWEYSLQEKIIAAELNIMNDSERKKTLETIKEKLIP